MPLLEREPKHRKEKDATFSKRQGTQIARITADIKRGPTVLADELDLDPSVVNNVLTGGAPTDQVEEVIGGITGAYPVSRLSLEVVRDDTDEGIIIMDPINAERTKRTFERINGRGEKVKYYDYFDSAMSAMGPFRPERIHPLRTVKDSDPLNPEAVYNNGHFLHQVTLYVGPVNLYWKDSEGAHVVELSTGDSSYKTPYIPHTFTNRDPHDEAYIMAVTFGSKLDIAVQQELSTLHPDQVSRALIDLTDSRKSFGDLLAQKLNESLLSPLHFPEEETYLDQRRVEEIIKGETIPNDTELKILARELGINVRDLLPPDVVISEEVVVKKYNESQPRFFPDHNNRSYEILELAGSTKTAATKSFSIKPLRAAESKQSDLVSTSHTFGFNYGNKPTILFWEGKCGRIKENLIEPKASFYIKPLVNHALRYEREPSKLMIVRVGGNLSGDTLFELSSLPPKTLQRISEESGLWY
ncbi:hypothetical protein A3G67_03125 [Candidatus Roizmanbacteria bacterium RIFCSPLOWO2_12_FULL_40_12]|uniref:HTH cro/C1-type domain-containing protein n=1 Tax=Candidatus Roizmanbacteria bacterium RIFCSPLOWO2_01_FULL_40_42 TaxID=1802066 RepID=A0A1F7J5D2_9BACT|nr:MAG: hypothetical protein A2779_02760 [Candidatus Roizmanbacteria bacterium RIFCSPHIGHO2_01_FULL_40_98]OGK28264.1 MAG: hypothetical protein A3C31_00125 [Candidatus Roizmanbacteria bacterium RIFCSPHIGHO2_02_FULL_40_53]OGK30500.1 MAG: hypothetical protein A2W49_02810 [Candidatus Roizmanbacteria bacterium RIFCSPHIGHO2_12_41_18]OGK36914.1 MAG: hypothetical protein A3E69_00385 [Candidatus Roizmanbacteria bacterium RIFCSPHIGHO2_12_FULL_40_130]OGK50820.1 MAG: hypothetical protein A3B50_00895 [Candi